jgi:hypothetical protein
MASIHLMINWSWLLVKVNETLAQVSTHLCIILEDNSIIISFVVYRVVYEINHLFLLSTFVPWAWPSMVMVRTFGPVQRIPSSNPGQTRSLYLHVFTSAAWLVYQMPNDMLIACLMYL